MPATFKVQFAATDLETQIKSRAPDDIGPDRIARRDLGRYYEAIHKELANVRASLNLTPVEARALAIAHANRIFATIADAKTLWAHVREYVDAQEVARAGRIDGMNHHQWNSLIDRLRALTPFAARAVTDALERYWIRIAHERAKRTPDPIQAGDQILRDVGLIP